MKTGEFGHIDLLLFKWSLLSSVFCFCEVNTVWISIHVMLVYKKVIKSLNMRLRQMIREEGKLI
jgi:hypothetical protein